MTRSGRSSWTLHRIRITQLVAATRTVWFRRDGAGPVNGTSPMGNRRARRALLLARGRRSTQVY